MALTADDVVLQKTPFSFDVSVWEFFWPLIVGARLVMAAPGAHRDPARLLAAIDRHGVTTLHFVPSMLQAFVGSMSSARALRGMLRQQPATGLRRADLQRRGAAGGAARSGAAACCRRLSWRTCTARPRPRSM